MSYHLTTSVSAKNIFENGMNPSKKEEDVMEDIRSLASLLSDEGRRLFFSYALKEKGEYSFSSIPKLNVRYGKKPEWYLNLTFYNNGNVSEILQRVMMNMDNESKEAKDKMMMVVSKYHDLYENSSRTLVVIPNLNTVLTNDAIDSLGINSTDKLTAFINHLLYCRSTRIDEISDKDIPSSNLMFIDTNTKSLVDFKSDGIRK